MTIDDRTPVELEAAVYRRLVKHLRQRTDVQHIDLMNLSGFCRNCLSNWMKDAADAKGLPMTKDESREAVYGMPYDEWRKRYQRDASPEQQAAFVKSQNHYPRPPRSKENEMAATAIFAKSQLKALVERVERLEEEKKALSEDIREVYGEAKANGFDTKAMRVVIRLRQQDTDERREHEALVELYREALGLIAK